MNRPETDPLKKITALNCPVDFIKVDENRVRVVALFVLACALFYFLNSSRLIIVFLLADFLLRSLNQNEYSPLALLSKAVVKQVGLKPKPVDRAPKRFAAFMGLIFLSTILALLLAGQPMLAKIIAAILIIFASLESFLGFCAGCYVYTFVNRIKSRS